VESGNVEGVLGAKGWQLLKSASSGRVSVCESCVDIQDSFMILLIASWVSVGDKPRMPRHLLKGMPSRGGTKGGTQKKNPYIRTHGFHQYDQQILKILKNYYYF